MTTTDTQPSNTGGSDKSKPNESRTGLNASETASELNATMNIKKSHTIIIV